IDFPHSTPMLPGAFDEAVIERQGHDIEAEVGCALDVAMAAENVGAVAEIADIAGREQQDAAGTDIGRAGRELGLPHGPDQAGGLLLGEYFSDVLELRFRDPRDTLGFIGSPLLDLLAHFVHAVASLATEL